MNNVHEHSEQTTKFYNLNCFHMMLNIGLENIAWLWRENNLTLTYFYVSRDEAFILMSERQRGHAYYQYNPQFFK